ncbi:MAG: LPS-assembly protein LptD [Rhodobacteraceae bacterium]|nr:LPS-assembly protein LptD [Paracoccaceae bacterium]
MRRSFPASSLRGILAVLTVLACAVAPLIARAQSGGDDITTIVADVVQIQGEDLLIAEGNVEVFSRGDRLRASKLTYDRNQDRLWLEGPIYLQQEDGTVLLADQGELTTDFTSGILEGARIILNQQLQIAGSEAIRREGRFTDLKRVVASSCEICEGGGTPLWEIRASRVIHDQENAQIYFYNARFRIAGIPVFYAPTLRVPDGTVDRVRGFLTPYLYSTNQIGNGVKLPYFIPLGDHADLTLTPFIAGRYSNGGIFSQNSSGSSGGGKYTRTLEGRYRQAFAHGDLTIKGAISQDSITPDETRGYAFVEGKFALPRDFVLGFTLQTTSDDAYLRDYGYSNQDFLTNSVGVLRTRQNERIEADIVGYQSLRADTDDSQDPDLVANGRWDRRLSESVLGGWVDFGLAGLALQRPSDQDIIGRDLGQFRATTGWTRNWTGPAGLRFNATGKLNADFLQVSDDPTYPEYQSALTPQAAATLSWPLMAAGKGRTRYLLEPLAQLAWTAPDTLDAPNDDSTAIALDTGNLFALNRFPGLNLYEEGTRANLALRWTRYDPKAWTFALTAGQVYRFDTSDQFPVGTGLAGRSSNWLGQVDIDFTDKFALRSVVLLDSDLKPTSNATRISVDAWNLRLSSNYIWQREDTSEELDNDLSAIGAAASYEINDTWSGSVEFRRDFTANKFTYREVGLGYENECVRVDLSVTQSFRRTQSTEPITSYEFSVKLAGFGSRTNAVQRQRCTSGG